MAILIAAFKTPSEFGEEKARLALRNTIKLIQGNMTIDDYRAYVQNNIAKEPSILWKIAGAALIAAGAALGVLSGLTAVGTCGLGTGAAIGFGLGGAVLLGMGIGFFRKSTPSMVAKETMLQAVNSLALIRPVHAL